MFVKIFLGCVNIMAINTMLLVLIRFKLCIMYFKTSLSLCSSYQNNAWTCETTALTFSYSLTIIITSARIRIGNNGHRLFNIKSPTTDQIKFCIATIIPYMSYTKTIVIIFNYDRISVCIKSCFSTLYKHSRSCIMCFLCLPFKCNITF